MPNRYKEASIIRDENRKRRLSTLIIPSIPKSEADVYIRTTTTDRLDLLANKFYGDVSYWVFIAAANGLGKGSLFVAPETKLRIPNIDILDSIIEEANNSR